MALKIIHVILLATVKYFFTFPYSLIIGIDYHIAMPVVIVGGVAGFLFFYYLSHRVIIWSDRVKPYMCKFIPRFIKERYRVYCERKREKVIKIFSKRSRFIARLKSTYGLWGIIITTPVLLTIPLGAFLASKYYSRRKYIVLYMLISIVGWGAIVSAFFQIFPAIVN